MKTSDVAAIRCPWIGVDPKGPSLDTVPGRKVTPFLEKVETFLRLCAFL
jgi:hypothetical protein